jgi:hypothetical protein
MNGVPPALREQVLRIVDRTPITDLHTHLYSPKFGPMLLWGLDELLTYHYLLAEVVRAARVPYERLWAMTRQEKADLVWRELFIERSPVSEACRGVLTVLSELGLDVTSRDLNEYREWFRAQEVAGHVDRVFYKANLRCAVMTNDPFDPQERELWLKGVEVDPRFPAALRLDPLLNDWAGSCDKLRAWGYDTEPSLRAKTLAEIRRFLTDWMNRMQAVYAAVSLPPTFAFPEESPRAEIITECVVPVMREFNRPFAMMIGVKRNVNPLLRLAADGVGLSSVDVVARICTAFPDNKFMVTMLARENQHELCVTARKFPNLFLFGCWWFLNNPSFIDEMTRMRMELLGLSFTPQHSDARVLDQVIYKWRHSKKIIADVLAEKYADLSATGWSIRQEDVEKDVTRILDTNFWQFVEQ